jgi:hypothetical protein
LTVSSSADEPRMLNELNIFSLLGSELAAVNAILKTQDLWD